MTRSRKKLDLQEIEQLAFVGCSVKEIALYLERDEAELRSGGCRRAIRRGWMHSVITLRRRMFELAIGGNVPLLLFLHKNPQSLNELRSPFEDLTEEQLMQMMKRSYEEVGVQLRREGYLPPLRPAGSEDAGGTPHPGWGSSEATQENAS